MYGKSNMETYIIICKIDSQREFSVWPRNLNQGLYHPSGVGWGMRWEEGLKGRDICILMADSCLGLTENNKISKAIILQ